MTTPDPTSTPPEQQPYGQPYAQQPYTQQNPYYAQQPYGYAPVTPTNTLAIIALVAAFVFSPAAIVLGHIALGQIKRTGEKGRELALTGLILGYVFAGLTLIFVIGYAVMMVAIFGAAGVFSTF